jgi:hypothetical protein
VLTSLQAASWADEEFSHADLGDLRRTKRLVAMGARVACRPAGAVTRVYDLPAEREAAFRFIESDQFSYRDVVAASRVATVRRAAIYPFAFVAMDGSTLTLTDRSGKGFGPVSNKGSARGMQAMTALVLSPAGVPLGTASQVLWVRADESSPEHHDDYRPIEERETRFWLDALDQVTDQFRITAPNTVPWFLMDRGADVAQVIEKASRLNVAFTIRACYDRRLTDGRKLWRVLAHARRLGSYVLEVSASPSRTARRARIEVRATRVALHLTLGVRGRRPHVSVEVWAVEARERNPPAGEDPILWRLLTNRRVTQLDEAMQVIASYTRRWSVEEFHFAWKSGLCDVERSQLRAPEHFAKWATLLAAVAARAERLKQLSREQPDLPATVEFTRDEIDAVIVLRKPAGIRLGAKPTIGQVVRWIAELGGYTGKSSGGPPGVKVIGRALPEVMAAAAALAAFRPKRRNG